MSTSILEQLLRAQMMLHAEGAGMGEGEEEDEGNELDSDSQWFNKDALVRDHNLLKNALNRLTSVALTMSASEATGGPSVPLASEATGGPSVPLRGLRPLLVRNLQVGRHHKGRVLYGELCVEPLKMVAVQTILVDEVGLATKLSVYNALPHQHTAQKMCALFPKGLKVAIKEPYFKVAMDGSLMIRVDNPADFVRNPTVNRGSGGKNICTSSSSSSSPSSSVSSSPDQPGLLVDARDLRNQGNQAFAAQDWKQAIQLYTDAMKVLLPRRHSSLWLPSSLSPEVSKELVLSFSNRAEARLRLKHFEAAESDARIALQLQKDHVKSLSRRGRALHGLHQYKEAALCFKGALQMTGDGSGVRKMELTSLLQASGICDKQARTGKYNLLKMWTEVEEGRDPVCGEYIGPVEIGPAREKSLGRGLLVTRDVEPGDLLIVSKAVAHAKLDRSEFVGLSEEEINYACTGSKSLSSVSNIYHEDIALQVLGRAISSERFREQVYSLSSADLSGVENSIPPMNLFAPKPASTGCEDISNVEEKVLSIDLKHIRKVTARNAFEVAGELGATLWLLPSFINHSCLPNACWMRVGKEALFVRAVRHLAKGQEVTISYLDNPALSLALRASFLQQCRGFECRCERCSFEKTMEPFTKQFELKVALQPTDIMGAVEVVRGLEWAFQNIVAFEEEKKKQWLRISYLASYALILDKAILQQTFKDIQPLETILRAVQETLGGSEDVLTLVSQRVCLGDCPPHVKAIVAAMYVCLYGKQSPATLRELVALRNSMTVNTVLTKLLGLGVFGTR